ncbi:MAG: DNA-binding protein [Thalassolituus sp.]|jgi:prophage regulatory protein|nr:MAG: DNA-binding protein [Thalassolituus sp.]HCG79116.1 DNA-binding protein [Oceanospirillales bacterium]
MTERILRRPEVQKLVGLSRSSLYARIASGDFPRPIKLGGIHSRSVGWPESQVSQWISERTTADCGAGK